MTSTGVNYADLPRFVDVQPPSRCSQKIQGKTRNQLIDPVVDDTARMDGQINYLGATVFWFYNLAALFFTAIVIHTILAIPQVKPSKQEHWRREVGLFSAMACVSFAMLSFNMLRVLIESFGSWSRDRESSAKASMVASVWNWSITSTLFRDFGEAIVEDGSRYLWAQSALLATLSVCVYMAQEGRMSS